MASEKFSVYPAGVLALGFWREWLLRGSLSDRSSKCGKPNCHCANGEPHPSVYLLQSHDGKLRQICVPKAWQDRVRHAVSDYRELQRLLEEVSELEWKRLQERKS